MVNKLFECPNCKKGKYSHTRGIFYTQTRFMNRQYCLFLICSTCKTILPLFVNEPIKNKVKFGSGQIYCCYQRLFKVFDREDGRFGLKCKKCLRERVTFKRGG